MQCNKGLCYYRFYEHHPPSLLSLNAQAHLGNLHIPPI
jgi:hypothetical protein